MKFEICKKYQIYIILAKYPFGYHEWPVSISAALCQGPYFRVAAVASCWQRVGDLISFVFESRTSCSRSRRHKRRKL